MATGILAMREALALSLNLELNLEVRFTVIEQPFAIL